MAYFDCMQIKVKFHCLVIKINCHMKFMKEELLPQTTGRSHPVS